MVAAFDDVEDKGRAVARQRWLLTPAAVVVTAGRGGSIGVGVGIGGSSSGGEVTVPAAWAAVVSDNGDDGRGNDGSGSVDGGSVDDDVSDNSGCGVGDGCDRGNSNSNSDGGGGDGGGEKTTIN